MSWGNLVIAITARRRIYTLNGLPPEVIAVAFAKSSRSPEPFDVIADGLNDEKSSEFHEKWVVGYGHSSVAEHAVLSLAIENVSILATKVIEDNRLASYTEKSTRYQVFDKTCYLKPRRIMDSHFSTLYQATADFLFDSYAALIPRMDKFLRQKYPRGDTQSKLYEIQIKNKALDNLRYLLPIATLTNLGMTCNARALEHAAVKLLSHPLEEMQEIGNEIKEAAQKAAPTLIKYVKANDYLRSSDSSLKPFSISEAEESDTCNTARLVDHDKDAQTKIISALIYRNGDASYEKIRKHVEAMDDQEKENIIDSAFIGMGRFDWPVREAEYAYYTFDILMDYGAFRDVQRHRMATQTNQQVTVKHGYCMPDEVTEAGIDAEYMECMDRAIIAYKSISQEFPGEAAYIVPLAFRKRMLFKANLRELYHFIKLRSGKMGHPSYRRIAQQMYHQVKDVHPLLAKHMAVDLS